MKRVKIGALILALVVALILPVCSQALDPHRAISQYVRDFWNSDNGLPQNSVQTILQSLSGYLWLGTQQGLVSFDGVQFTTFDSTNTPAMKDEYISAIVEDHARSGFRLAEASFATGTAGFIRSSCGAACSIMSFIRLRKIRWAISG